MNDSITIIRSPFGEQLRAWRRARGWSQLELEHRAGLVRSRRYARDRAGMVSTYEAGFNYPSRDTAVKLAYALGVPWDDFWQCVEDSKATFGRKRPLPRPDGTQRLTTRVSLALPAELLDWIVEVALQEEASFGAYARAARSQGVTWRSGRAPTRYGISRVCRKILLQEYHKAQQS